MTTGGDNAEQNIHSGENNSQAKLSKEDVINIREAYNNHAPKREIYALYENRISKSGFDKIWSWKTWKNILPEYHSQENINWYSTKGKALSSEQASLNAKKLGSKQASLNASKIKEKEIYLIRELYDSGVSEKDILELLKLPIQEVEIRRIGQRKKFKNI